jgi:hypothetical protein
MSTRVAETTLSEVGNDDFVIGILGGSVAGSFAQYAMHHENEFEPLRKAIKAVGNKNLRIVNLANGGYKQPQQFFVAAYFADKLDLVINIDGYNDAQPAHLLPVYPLEFPNFPQFYGRAGQGGFYAALGRSARWLYKKMNSAPLAIPGLSYSNFYFLNWYPVHKLLYRIIKGSESAYYAKEFTVHQPEMLRTEPPKTFVQKRIAIWKKYTILEDDIVRKRMGKPAFFFLQPNQYLKDSKPFSEQERQAALEPTSIEGNHEIMVLLKEGAQDLRRSHVPITDLTNIFSDTKDTVYKDACCHLNDLGNRIMAQAVVSSISVSQQTARR